MKPLLTQYSMLLMLAGLLLAGGCVLPPDLVDSVTFELQELGVGFYWADYADGELAVFEMPRSAADAGRWRTYPGPSPDWYDGPSLYQLTAAGIWERAADDNDQTLDDWLQVWDAAPVPTDPQE